MITGTSSRCLRPRGWDLGSEQSCRVMGVGAERWRHLSAPVPWGRRLCRGSYTGSVSFRNAGSTRLGRSRGVFNPVVRLGLVPWGSQPATEPKF